MALKEGNPSTEELLNLAHDIGTKWKNLGRALGIPEPEIDTVDAENRLLLDKAYKMLLIWHQGRGGAATYAELNNGLRHMIVLRVDLAEKYCFVQPEAAPHGPIAEEAVHHGPVAEEGVPM